MTLYVFLVDLNWSISFLNNFKNVYEIPYKISYLWNSAPDRFCDLPTKRIDDSKHLRIVFAIGSCIAVLYAMQM